MEVYKIYYIPSMRKWETRNVLLRTILLVSKYFLLYLEPNIEILYFYSYIVTFLFIIIYKPNLNVEVCWLYLGRIIKKSGENVCTFVPKYGKKLTFSFIYLHSFILFQSSLGLEVGADFIDKTSFKPFHYLFWIGDFYVLG